MGEFKLINIFKNRVVPDGSVIVPSGDDAAVVCAPEGHELVMTIDTMNEGVHFPIDTNPHAIGFKSLAVSISDIAAMGATPKWVTASLSLPHSDEAWCREFADGFFECADQFGVILIGGDITRGPLAVTTQVTGIVPKGKAILQSTAKVDDDIYVSGYLGSGAAGLAKLSVQCTRELNYPSARVELGLSLQSIATAMIDLSDGLSQDLHRLCTRSGVGAEIEIESVPRLPGVHLDMALHGGDDYELCFTVNPKYESDISQLAAKTKLPITKIGKVVSNPQCFNLEIKGFQHF